MRCKILTRLSCSGSIKAFTGHCNGGLWISTLVSWWIGHANHRRPCPDSSSSAAWSSLEFNDLRPTEVLNNFFVNLHTALLNCNIMYWKNVFIFWALWILSPVISSLVWWILSGCKHKHRTGKSWRHQMNISKLNLPHVWWHIFPFGSLFVLSSVKAPNLPPSFFTFCCLVCSSFFTSL